MDNNDGCWKNYLLENNVALNLIDFFELFYQSDMDAAKKSLKSVPGLT